MNLLVKGSWEKSKYGYALVVNEFKEIIPPTKDGIIAYLSATVYGIKESMAKKIVGQFGLQTLRKSSVSSGFKRLRCLKTAPNSS